MSEADRSDVQQDAASETQQAESEARQAQDIPLPPATFEWLVYSLQLEAQAALGLLHFGEEKDRPAPDLKRAQYSIDMLAMLQQKTRGNLTLEEQRMLENGLTELRFRYVQAASGRPE